MGKEQVGTNLGGLAVSTSFAEESRGNLFFWAGMFFDGTMWDSIIEAFDGDYNIVVVDPPGHGGSEAPQRIFSMNECALAAVEVLDHYQLSSSVIVGLSWGGFVAQALFKQYPDRCEGLVLLNTCAAEPILSEKIMFSVLPIMLSLIGAKPFQGALINALLSESAIKNNAMLVSKLRGYLRTLNFKTMKKVFYSVMTKRAGLEDCFGGRDVKCLVIFGYQDAAMDKVRTDQLISLLPAPTVVGLEVGHNAVLEAPDQVISAMKNFLK